MSATQQNRDLHDPISAHAIHGYVRHSQKTRDEQRVNERLHYIGLLDEFAKNPTPGKLGKLLGRRLLGASSDIDPIQFADTVSILREKLVTALGHGDQEGYERWYNAITQHNDGLKRMHPLTEALLDKLDDNNPLDNIAESMLRAQPEAELRRRIRDLAKGTGVQYDSTGLRFGLLTAIAAHAPQLMGRKNLDRSGINAVRAGLLGTTASGDVTAIALRLVGQNRLGRMLRTGFRIQPDVLSAGVWQATIDHAQNGHVPTNIIEALPAAIAEVIGMTFGGGNYRAANHAKYFSDEARDFLRRTPAALVRGAQVADVANSLAAVEMQRQSDVDAIDAAVQAKIEPLAAKQEKGLRVGLSKLPWGLGKPFAGFAVARHRRISQKIANLRKQGEHAVEGARSRGMTRRAHELKQCVRLAASLTMLHKPKSEQLKGFRDNLYVVVQTALAQASPAETPRFLAQVASVVGGIRRDVRAPLAQPETYQPIMDQPQTPHSHAANLLALASGVQRAPEALVGYMHALHRTGQLTETINYMQEQTAKGDRVYKADMGLFAQALGATAYQAREAGDGTFSEATFGEDFVRRYQGRFLQGHTKGISDPWRPKAPVQTDMLGNRARPVAE